MTVDYVHPVEDSQLDFQWLEKSCSHLGQDKFNELKEILLKSSSLFNKSLGRTELLKHRIVTNDHTPIRTRSRWMNLMAIQEIDRQLQNMLKQEVIEPSASLWASPIVLVKKKTGNWQLCIDYHKLNAITIKDVHPLPCIDRMLDALQGSLYFTVLDLHVVAIGKSQCTMRTRKNGFYVPTRPFPIKTMPMSLCNAAATFQQLMQNVFLRSPMEKNGSLLE